jgi:hypothetical protein
MRGRPVPTTTLIEFVARSVSLALVCNNEFDVGEDNDKVGNVKTPETALVKLWHDATLRR